MNNVAVLQKALAQTRVIPDYIRLLGGLDEITPPYQRKSGSARTALNFEALTQGGYRRIPGYERYNGMAKPSDASYATLQVGITGTYSVGDTIVGGTSAATAKVLAVVTSATPNYLVITKITGTFAALEQIKVGGVSQGTSANTASTNGATNPLLHATYRNLAADNYRADIAAIPGAGNILGVFEYQDVVYGFRNNVGNTAAAMHKSSAGGWVIVPLGRQLSFTSGGTTPIAEGNTITGASSGATAVITRVVLTSGSWAGGTAAGKFIFASQTGTFQAENIDVGASPNLATIAGNSTAITLLPNGRYEFDIKNFGGLANGQRVYGCDGVNKGFEFDGTVYVPIDTGMTTDAPSHVKVHKKQLFFSFFGSVQHCAPGQPYIWSPVLGAAEIALGDSVTGFSVQPGSATSGALAIFTRNRLAILYGNGVSDWNLQPYRDEIGAYAHTIQDVGFTMFLDDRGITDLQTSQNYGNFAHNAVTNQIKNRVNSLRPTAVSSCISRDQSEYRLFFSGGEAIYITLVGRKVVGIMPMLFSDVVRCIWSSERMDGSEAIYFGSGDGHIYQMEKGTSFDGDPIEGYLNLAYNFQGSPRVNKHYVDCSLELDGSGYAAFNFGYALGYSSLAIPQPGLQSITGDFSVANWDSFVWDAFYWDGVSLGPSNIDIDGDAENISLAISSNSDIYEPFTITAAMIHYTLRGRIRP